MSSLLRKPLLRSKSHFSSEAAALLTHGPIGDVHTEETQHHQQSDDEESQTGKVFAAATMRWHHLSCNKIHAQVCRIGMVGLVAVALSQMFWRH